jgi:hypothetical protein
MGGLAMVKLKETHGTSSDSAWYAGLAMQAMIAKQGIPDSPTEREEIALWAHRMAEAMVTTAGRLHPNKQEPED